eukprot:3812880-Rhodomonas_salina.1
MALQPRALAATLAMAAAFLLVLAVTESAIKQSRTGLIQQKLAYDGPYDTPPVTWYYPANTGTYFTGENTLGYEWKDVQYQVPSVTYEPGQLRLLPTRAMCDPLGSRPRRLRSASFCADRVLMDGGMLTVLAGCADDWV